MEDLNIPVSSWNSGYSYNSPLPGALQNPNNIPAVLNPNTGEISFTSFTQGAFPSVVKVSAFKTGKKVVEIFREMQIVLLDCDTNNPPTVSAPFQNPVTLQYTSYIDSVFAGELITFPITIFDMDTLPGGQQQAITLEASGAQFGTNFTDSNSGCLNPPCAMLNPPPPITGQLISQTNFSWQTDCSHLASYQGYEPTSTTYNFIIKARDNFCPVPGMTIKTVTIVIEPHKLQPPQIQNVHLDSNNKINIYWSSINDNLNIL